MTDLPDTRLVLEVRDGVAILRIDRPDKLNALDDVMVGRLSSLCADIERMDDVHAVILTGTGRRSFCAGGDIEAWSGRSPAEFARFWVREGHEAFDRLARLRQPVIAVLNGHTLGGGLELAACADYRIAESHVKIGQPETSLGIIPGWSGTQRLVRRFGAGVVRRMALFGDIYPADEALRLGLVDQVAGEGEGMEAAHALAARLAGRGRLAGELTKMLINVAEGEETARAVEALAGAIAAGSDELKEGIAAFREKRKPRF